MLEMPTKREKKILQAPRLLQNIGSRGHQSCQSSESIYILVEQMATAREGKVEIINRRPFFSSQFGEAHAVRVTRLGRQQLIEEKWLSINSLYLTLHTIILTYH